MSDSETGSHREEQGKRAEPEPRERMGQVPIAFSTAGVLGTAPADGPAVLPGSHELEQQREKDAAAEEPRRGDR